MVTRFDTFHERDKRTDSRTDTAWRHSIARQKSERITPCCRLASRPIAETYTPGPNNVDCGIFAQFVSKLISVILEPLLISFSKFCDDSCIRFPNRVTELQTNTDDQTQTHRASLGSTEWLHRLLLFSTWLKAYLSQVAWQSSVQQCLSVTVTRPLSADSAVAQWFRSRWRLDWRHTWTVMTSLE